MASTRACLAVADQFVAPRTNVCSALSRQHCVRGEMTTHHAEPEPRGANRCIKHLLQAGGEGIQAQALGGPLHLHDRSLND